MLSWLEMNANQKSCDSTTLNRSFLSFLHFKQEYHQTISDHDCPPGYCLCVNCHLTKNFVCQTGILVIVNIFTGHKNLEISRPLPPSNISQLAIDMTIVAFLLLLYECSRVHSCVQNTSAGMQSPKGSVRSISHAFQSSKLIRLHIRSYQNHLWLVFRFRYSFVPW